jgi:methyl-accepting chemotaxis protein
VNLKSIQLKIVLLSGMCLVATTVVLLLIQLYSQSRTQEFVGAEVSTLIRQQTKTGLLALARSEAGIIRSKLETNIVSARTLADAFKTIRQSEDVVGDVDMRQLFSDILLQVLEDNKEFLGAYSAWEPDALDGQDVMYAGTAEVNHDATGRFVPYWNRDENGRIAIQPLVGFEDTSLHPNGVRKGGWYLSPRERRRENILDPFPYIVQGKQEWLTTMSAPILIDGKFYGVAGTDLRLDFVQNLCVDLVRGLYEGTGTVRVVSNMGIIVADSANPENIGRPLGDTTIEGWEQVAEAAGAGKELVELGEGDGVVTVQVPVQLARTGTPWSVMIEVPRTVVFAKAFELIKDMEANASDNLIMGIIAGVLVALAACAVLWFLSTGIVRPIRKSVVFAENVASGNLDDTLDVRQADEIGVLAKALQTMVVKLKEMIAEAEEKSEQAAAQAQLANEAMQEANEAKRKAELAEKEGKLQAAVELEKIVDVVSAASEKMMSQVDFSRRGSEQQTQQIAEVATAMEEMNATVLEVAQSATLASETADEAKTKATDGNSLVSKVMEQLTFVQESSEQTVHDMTALGDKANEIGKIMDVISDIADQTNLLALNAAIEAARAGDAGRGFAVVADEVRKLAEKTMSATTEVGEAISGIQDGTRKNISNVQKANNAIQDVSELADQSSGALNEIVDLSSSNSSQISSIATASEEQSATSEQINKNVGEINRISAESLQAMQESAEAVGELAEQVNILQELINRMKDEGR